MSCSGLALGSFRTAILERSPTLSNLVKVIMSARDNATYQTASPRSSGKTRVSTPSTIISNSFALLRSR